MTDTNGNQQANEEKAQLFGDFSPVPYEEWRAEAEKSLKGASFDKKLITKTYEGFSLQPMYRHEDVADLTHPLTMPGASPFVRGTSILGYVSHPWSISQEIAYSTPETYNAALRYDMQRGQTAASIILDQATRVGLDPDQAEVGTVGKDGVSLATVADLATALDGIDLATMPVIIRAAAVGLPVAAMLTALAQQQGKDTTALTGWIENDPLGTLAHSGSLPLDIAAAYNEMADLTAWAAENAPQLRTIGVSAHPYHNSGGNATQDLAFALATGVEYIRAMQERGLDVDTAALRMGFGFSVGTNLFIEIAKLRAARMLWSQAVAAFGGSEEAQKMFIHARTSNWNKTQYDPYVNMLRTTVESFGGAIGGCNSMHVGPFDEVVHEPDEFSRRIARNTQLILQQECNFTRLIDPAGGSWYIEWLTNELARNAWALFQEVEKQGGMLKALQAGFPQQKVAAVDDERTRSLATRRDVLIGTNMYPNLYEKQVDVRTVDYPAIHSARSSQVRRTNPNTLASIGSASGAERFAAVAKAAQAGATLNELTTTLRGSATATSIEPLNVHRGAEPFEALRGNAEAHKTSHGHRPRVFLANMGPIPQHKGRADFATGFLEVGGFEMVRPNGFQTPEEAANAALESGAPVVVICSTDDTYPDLVPPLVQQIKATKADVLVLLAGYPQDHVESFKAAGVDDFIHLRANCYQMNVQLQQKIGVSA